MTTGDHSRMKMSISIDEHTLMSFWPVSQSLLWQQPELVQIFDPLDTGITGLNLVVTGTLVR